MRPRSREFARQLDRVVDVIFPAGADEEAVQTLTSAGRDQNRRRDRFDHFVGSFRAPIQAGRSFAPRPDDGEIVLAFGGRLVQNLPDRFARPHDNLRRNAVARVAFSASLSSARAQRLFVAGLLPRFRAVSSRMARTGQQSTELRRLVSRVGAVAANQDAHKS